VFITPQNLALRCWSDSLSDRTSPICPSSSSHAQARPVTISGDTADDAKKYQEKAVSASDRGRQKMKESARYVKIVEWKPLPPPTSGRDYASKMLNVA
jgi:hypothetical protein